MQFQMLKLMQNYTLNFRQILPRQKCAIEETKYPLQINKELVIEIIDQFDITMQLLVQQMLYCPNQSLKTAAYNLFHDIVQRKNQLINCFNLRKFKVYLDDFVSICSF